METRRLELVRRFIAKYVKGPFGLFAKDHLKIKAKSGRLVPFIMNPAQEHIDRKLTEQLERLGKIRALLLKGRQQGGSTYIGGRFYKKTSHSQGRSTFILSHDAKTTSQLYEMVKRFHNNLNPIIRPLTSRSNAQELRFKKRDASYFLGTARNKEVGRGFTAHHFHGSEAAFWPWADAIIAGVINTIPPEDGTEIVFESTANGASGKFYDMCMLAKKPFDERSEEEQSDEYILIFVPWYWQTEYRAEPPKHFKRNAGEHVLAALLKNHPDGSEYNWNITDAQLFWRRKKIQEGGPNKFKQEYPSHVLEAFLFSGRPVFDPNDTERALAACREPLGRYEVTEGGRIYERPDGLLKVWQKPKKGARYAIGVDVAEGLEHGDWSSIDVVNEAGKQVAHWHGHISPKLLGGVIAHIGKYYNNAFVGVERNNHGLTTLEYLQDEHGYRNVYIERELEKTSKRTLRRPGWLTTSKSKPLIIDRLAELLREGDSGIRCAETIDEMRLYVIDEKGRYAADTGRCDDRVMSYAIAQEMRRCMPRKIQESNDDTQQTVADNQAGY